MNKRQIIELLLKIREEAVFDEIFAGKNNDATKEFQFAFGREEAVCEVLNSLMDDGDISGDELHASFERGRNRGRAAVAEKEATDAARTN